MTDSIRNHWDKVYTRKAENEVSWFEDVPAVSLELIAAAGATRHSSIIDVGGGASRLADALLAAGFDAVSVLDISPAALESAKARLGPRADRVTWLVADVTRWDPDRTYDVWHDRAAFHFLVKPEDQAAYVERLTKGIAPDGAVIIGTFALDGPQMCSGLPVQRYDGATLAKTLGRSFELIETRRHQHRTPANAVQNFQFSRLRRVRAP